MDGYYQCNRILSSIFNSVLIMINKAKDIKLMVGGEEVKGIKTKSLALNNGEIVSCQEFSNVKISDIILSMEIQFKPMDYWLLKNDLFIKNRPPRGMQK